MGYFWIPALNLCSSCRVEDSVSYLYNSYCNLFCASCFFFFLFFSVVAKPLLEVTFHIFLYLGRLGLTFQVSILADLLALVSFHIYCIYVYAARFVSSINR